MDKRGITISMLAITIVVMSIIIGTAVFTGVANVNNANFDRYISSLNSVEELSAMYKLQNGEYPVVKQNGNVVEVNINSLEDKLKEQIDKNNDVFSNLKVIDTNLINISNLTIGRAYEADKNKYLLSKDVFLINTESGRVYYMKGYTNSGIRYYSADQK